VQLQVLRGDAVLNIPVNDYSRTRVIFFTSGVAAARASLARGAWRFGHLDHEVHVVKTARSSAMVIESMFEPASAFRTRPWRARRGGSPP